MLRQLIFIFLGMVIQVIPPGGMTAYAGGIAFSGQVFASSTGSTPLAGTITSFEDMAAVRLVLPFHDYLGGKAVLKVSDAVGRPVPHRIIRGAGKGTVIVLFKLSKQLVQDMRFCVGHPARAGVNKPDNCIRYRVVRAAAI